MAKTDINFGVGFTVDKSGLDQIKKFFQELKNLSSDSLNEINVSSGVTKGAAELKKDLQDIKDTAGIVGEALEDAYNPKINSINIEKFNLALKNSGMSLDEIHTNLSKAGLKGEIAFNGLTTSLLTTNKQLKNTNKFLDNAATTLANTVKWNIASSAVNMLSGTLQQAVGYVKSLDSSLNDIRIVTGESADEMDNFAIKANKAAEALGKSTTDYTEAALIYYQQGLSDEDVEARTDVTLKTANVTQQTTAEVSEQLTAVWNGYKVSADEAEIYVDRLAAIAAATASDLEELSTGMSKVASAAAIMGVNESQLASQIATIVSVTRQAPESVGTALKTVYARISDIKAGLDEDGATLGTYSGKMAEFGISVLDAQGNLRDMGEVMEEVGTKWSDMTREQQVSLAQTMGGQRQYSQLVSLFDNWDQYLSTMKIAENAQGTLNEQQSIYMESTAAHLNQLETSWESLYDSLLRADDINTVADAMNTLVSATTVWVDSLGGGLKVLQNIAPLLATVFKQQITSGLSKTLENFQITRANKKSDFELEKDIEQLTGQKNTNEATAQVVDFYKTISSYGKLVDEETQKQVQSFIKSWGSVNDVLLQRFDDVKQVQEVFNSNITGKALTESIPDNLSDKALDLANAIEQVRNNILDTTTDTEESMKNAVVAIENILDSGNLQYFFGEKLPEQNAIQVAFENISSHTWEEIQDNEELSKSYDIIVKYLTEIVDKYDAVANAANKADSLNAGHQFENKEMDAALKAAAEKRKQAKEFEKGLSQKQNIQSFVQLASAMGSAVTAGSNLIQTYQTLNDESLTTTEKIQQVASAFATTAIQMVNAVSAIQSIGKSLSSASGILGSVGGVLSGGWSVAGITALSVIIPIVVDGLDNLVNADEKAIEEFDDLNDTLETQKSTLESLQNEYDSNIEKLKEYQKLKSEDLTDADKKEIASLEAKNVLLEAQLEKEKALQEANQTQLIADYEKGNNSSNNSNEQATISVTTYKHNPQYDASSGLIDSSSYETLSYANPEGYSKWLTDQKQVLQEYKNAAADATKSVSERATYEQLVLDIEQEINDVSTQWSEGSSDAINQQYTLFERAWTYLNTAGAKNAEDVEKAKQDVADYYAMVGTLDSKIDNSLNGILNENNFNDIQGIFANVQQDVVTKRSELTSDELDSFFGQYPQYAKYIDILQTQADSLNITLADYLSNGTLKSADSFEKWSAAVEEAKQAAQTEAFNNLGNVINAFASGEDLDDTMQETLSTLESMYPALANLEQGTHEYIQTLRDLREAEEDAEQLDLADHLNALEAKLTGLQLTFDNDALSDDFKAGVEEEIEKTLSEISDATYQLDLKIQTDLDTDIENGFSIADELQQITDLQSDSLKISVDEVQEYIEKGYGAILQNSEVTTDGMIELDAGVKDAFIANRNAEIEADKNAQIQELQTKKDAVDAQIAALTQMITALDVYLSSAGTAREADAKDQVSTAYGTYVSQKDILADTATAADETADAQSEANKTASDNIIDENEDVVNDYLEGEKTSTTQQSINIRRRLQNLRQLLNGYNKVAEAVKNSENGITTSGNISLTNLQGGYKVAYTAEKTSNYTESNAADNLSDKKSLDDYYNDFVTDGSKESAKTLQKAVQAQKEALEIYSGEIQGSINAMRASSSENNLGSKNGAGSSSGSSSGSKGTSNETEVVDALESEQDIYHDINRELEDIQHKREQLADDTDELYGDDYVAALKEEIDLYNQENDVLEEKIGLIEDDIAAQQEALKQAGVTFNENGEISNYNDILKQAEADFEAKRAQYNAMSRDAQDNEAGKALKAELDELETRYKNLKSAMDNYDNTQDTWTEVKDKIDENADAVADLNDKIQQGNYPEAFNKWLSVLENVDDALSVVDDRLSYLEDEQDHLLGADKIANIEAQMRAVDLQAALNVVSALKDLSEVQDYLTDFKSSLNTMKQSMEKINELTKQVVGQDENGNDIYKTYDLNSIQDIFELFKDSKETLDHSSDSIKSIISTISKAISSGKANIGDLLEGFLNGSEGIAQWAEGLTDANGQALNLGEQINNELIPAVSNLSSGFFGVASAAYSIVSAVNNVILNIVSAIQNAAEKKIELKIEKFHVQIEADIDAAEWEKKWIEFQENIITSMNDADYLGIMKAKMRTLQLYLGNVGTSLGSTLGTSIGEGLSSSLDTYTSSQSSYLDTLRTYSATISNELNTILNGGESSIYGDHAADAMEDLETYTEKLMEAVEDVYETINDIYDTYLKGWDDILDQLNDQADAYDRINSQIEHNIKLVEMLYGDDAYAEMDAWYAQEAKNNNAKLDYLTKSIKLLQEQAAEQKKAISEATDEQSIAAHQEVLEKIEDQLYEMQDALNTAVEEATQNLIDKYQNAVEEIFDNMENQLTNGLGLDYLSDEWDIITEQADEYYDDINRAYETQKLAAEYQDAINDADGNVKAQKALAKLMDEQLSALEEKENLTKYDVERAEKLLALEQARIALEEAQKSKSTMRLRRDSNGNYSYQYVADEDSVSDAQQDYNDAQNELYNYDKDSYNDNLEKIQKVFSTYKEKMQQIASDVTLSADERQNYMQMLTEQYSTYANNLVKDNQTIQQNLTESAISFYKQLYGENSSAFDDMTQEEADSFMGTLVETWNSGNQQMADSIAGEDGFQVIATEALNLVKDAQDELTESIEETKEALGELDFTDTTSQIIEVDNATNDLKNDNDELIESIKDLSTAYENQIAKMETYIAQQKESLELAEQQIEANKNTIATQQTAVAQSETTTSKKKSWLQKLVGGLEFAGGLVLAVGGAVTGNPVVAGIGTGLMAGGASEYISSLDTGGYTGSFQTVPGETDIGNNKGKLAVLHEKELVLNQDDTNNILSAVQIMRDLSESMGTMSAGTAAGLAAGITGLGEESISDNAVTSLTEVNNQPSEVDQNVHIEATFPAVTDHSEIETALNNLVNIAAQRAMVKTR